jgi:hypothetical protein
MRMSDLVGSMDLTLFPIIGLVIFACLFGVLVARALMGDPREGQRAASMPLDADVGEGSSEQGPSKQERA